MELDGLLDDSRSITEFFKPLKKQVIQQKQKRKEQQQKRCRKNSMQLSIFGWLAKPRPKQTGKMAQLSKNLIVNILEFLRIQEILVVSQTCFYLNECAKTIWNDSQFLGQLETDQLSYKQLYFILHKSGKLSHIKQLRNIYRGKNLKLRRERIKLKLQKSNNYSLNPISGTLLEVFEISPKTMKSSTFLMDAQLSEVISSSFRSLTQIKLISCGCLKKFDIIAKCLKLTHLSITNNCFLSSDDLRVICKCCEKLQYLDISGCQYLDQNIFKYFSKLQNLETLILSHYNQPFVGITSLKQLQLLKNISIQNCCIMDAEAIQLVSSVKNLEILNISGCRLLTDSFINWLGIHHPALKIEKDRTQFSVTAIEQYQRRFQQ